MTDLQEWADLAVERLFKNGVRTCFDLKQVPDPFTIVYEEGYQPTVVLGRGTSWPEAVTKAWAAWKGSSYVRTEPIPAEPQTAPVGEEFIEEFVGAMRQRDIYTEFLIWYGEKSDEDPEAYPRALHRGEWLEQFGTFIAGLDK